MDIADGDREESIFYRRQREAISRAKEGQPNRAKKGQPNTEFDEVAQSFTERGRARREKLGFIPGRVAIFIKCPL